MIDPNGVITGVSIAYGTATVDEIDAASPDSQETMVTSLLSEPGVEEALSLSTCNRTEAYVVTDDPADGRAALAGVAPSVHSEAIVNMDHEESLQQLLRVAAGLQSQVLGEEQILGQLRAAYEDARGVGGIGPMLEKAVTKAIHVGERARTETAINDGIVSLGSAAAELAAEELNLGSTAVAVVGAGEMGTLAARALATRDVESLTIANRTISTAEHVAATVDVDASAQSLTAVPSLVANVDLVVTTTASDEPIVTPTELEDAGETVLIDLARPRDVAPETAGHDHATVYDLDDLEAVTERTHERRREAASTVESMIDCEFEHLLERYKRARVDDVIGAMYESAESVKREELERAYAKFDDDAFTERQREVLDAMADSIVNRLLAAPTKSLREAAGSDDWTTIHTALTLFDPEFDGGVTADSMATRGDQRESPSESVEDR